MAKYKVVLDHGKRRTVEADIVTIDPSCIRFDNRASAGKPGVLIAYFPAHTVSEVINLDKVDK